MDNYLGALAPGHVGLVPTPELLRVTEAQANLNGLMWRETLVRGADIRAWLMRNSQIQGPERMAPLFCEVMTRVRATGLASGDTCDLSVTRGDLGDALGMPVVPVNRTLMLLRSTGAVEFRGGRLTVRDWAKLADTALFDGRYLHLGDAYHL